MKKTLAFVLALVMVLSVFPAGLLFSSALTSGYYTYDVVNSSTVKITKYSGTEANVTIPGTLGGYPVTEIGTSAFSGNKTAVSIVIPDSVTVIGDNAFSNDDNLAGITLPGNLQTIGAYAFCGSKKLSLSAIPDSVTIIGGFAFWYCNITGISIGKGLSTLGERVFSECDALTQISVDSQNAYFSSRDNILFNKDQTKVIYCPPAATGAYAVPDGVTEIGDYAFYHCSKLTAITFPESLTKIGVGSFTSCSGMTTLTIGGHVSVIGNQGFINCNGITTVNIPSSLTVLGSLAFYSCDNLANIVVDGGNPAFASLDGVLFNHDKTTLLVYPCGKAGDYTVPATVKTIDTDAFNLCYFITSVTIPNSVITIKENAFYSCKGLVALTLGSGVKTIGDSAFSGCLKLENVEIPYGVSSIGVSAFQNCIKIPSVIIPSTVNSIGTNAFVNCSLLSKAYFFGNAPATMGTNIFNNCASGFNLCYISGKNGFTGSWNVYTTVTFTPVDITFNANGGTPVAALTRPANSSVSKPADPIKTGYTFGGWYGDTGFTTPVTWPYTVTENITFYAKWDILEGNFMTFDANGGTGGTSAAMVSGEALTAPTVTKAGYTFAGWSPAVPSTVPDADTTYTAQWTPNTYTVNYNGNGFTAGTTSSSSHTYDLSANLTANGFTKTGSSFLGWSTNAAAITPTYTDAQSVVNLTASQNGVVTFYAVWAGSPFTITFNSNGGSAINAVTQNNGTAVAKPADPVKTDYTFVGWYADEGLTPAVSWPYTINAADVTFYAKWVLTADTYTITFNSNGGSAVTAITQEGNTVIVKPADPVKTGHNFDGWYSNAGLTAPVSWPHTLTGNVTFYAKWTVNTVTITWNPNGGKWPDGTTGAKTTTTLDVPGTLNRTGYSFSSWSPAIPTTMPAANSTFTAQWSINSYTITFNAGYGTGSAAPVTQNYNTVVTLPTTGFTRTGYTFIGWNTSSSATTALSNFTVPSYNATLYAVYTMSYYGLMLKMNNGTNSNFAYFSLPVDTWVYYDHFDFNPYDPYDPPRIVPMVISDPYNPYNPYIYPPIYPPYPPDPPYNPNLYYITIEYPYFTPPPIYGPCGTTECYGYTPPARTGYDFVGWSESPTGTSTTSLTHMQAADKTLYAVWSPKAPVTITFNANGGTGGTSVQRIPGETLTAPSVTRAGYTLTGWTPSVPPSVPAASATYTAQWAANSYLITFDANGGTGGRSNMYLYGATPAPPIVTRTGYDFVGWSPAVAAVTGSATYTAQWILADYMITFDAHYGTGGNNATIRYGTPLTPPAVTREGYTFMGWSPGVPPTVPPANTTYIAQWSLSSNNLTLYANGGIGGTSFMLDFGSPITPPQLSKEGCIFAGWQPALPSAVVNGINAYEAQWIVNSYTIAFDANGGTGGANSLMQYGALLTAPAVAKTGYTFTGWSPEVPATVPGANTVYTAQWAINSVEITFDANDGIGGTIGVMACGDPLTPPGVSKEGYIFTGWSPAVPTKVIAGNQTYTATWMAVN